MKVTVKPNNGRCNLPSGKVITKEETVEQTKEVCRAIRFGDLIEVTKKVATTSKGDK